MPTYTFYNKRTKKEFTDLMSISEMEEYLSKNKHISQVIVPINMAASFRISHIKMTKVGKKICQDC